MRLEFPGALILWLLCDLANGFSQSLAKQGRTQPASTSQRYVSIGLGPDQTDEEEKKELVAGVDYEVPDHEAYRKSRRSKLDEKCDEWFASLLGTEKDKGVLGSLADETRKILLTPVELVNDEPKPFDDEEWTPYVSTKLPWTPLTPAFGLEEFGLPVPRRNAETWRHFDVASMVEQTYSGSTEGTGTPLELTEEQISSYQEKLAKNGGWLDDESCQARLVYINGRFAPQLSKTDEFAENLDNIDSASDEVKSLLSRLTDGFTDKLASPINVGDGIIWDSHKKLSGPDHNVGDPTTQFAINTQQGTACFAALNTIRTGGVAYIRVPKGAEKSKPVLVVNAVTRDGGASTGSEGLTLHPRCLLVAEENSSLSFVQSTVDLDTEVDAVPKLYNGYTQIFVHEGANVTHSFLEESGGMVTGGVEKTDDSFEEGETLARTVEAGRPELKDTRLEAIDVHILGEDGGYEGTILSVGGCGRVRIAHSVTLLQSGSRAKINGFSLSGGAQRTDCKTNIHHIADGTTSEQVQKNMIGGRATGAFRGRIRVEQSAQQTESNQLSRTILLSDRSRAWAVPSLEIIADDVQCTHGATVSDLSDEELFYLRSRGLDRALARNLLMYGFAEDVCACVDPAMLSAIGSKEGLQKRVIERLENVVPVGERAVRGEYQSV